MWATSAQADQGAALRCACPRRAFCRDSTTWAIAMLTHTRTRTQKIRNGYVVVCKEWRAVGFWLAADSSPLFRECCRHPYCAVTLPSDGPYRFAVLYSDWQPAAPESNSLQQPTPPTPPGSGAALKPPQPPQALPPVAIALACGLRCLKMRHQMILCCCAKISAHVFAHNSSRESMSAFFCPRTDRIADIRMMTTPKLCSSPFRSPKARYTFSCKTELDP